MPAGFTVVSAQAVAGSGKPSYAAMLTAPGDRSADVTTWLNGLESAGFTRNDEFGAANQASTAVVLENDRWTVSTITSVLDGRTQLAVNVDPR